MNLAKIAMDFSKGIVSMANASIMNAKTDFISKRLRINAKPIRRSVAAQIV